MASAKASGALPDVDFARIRPYGRPASRSGAFEELASILIEDGVVAWPEGVRFRRFANPDGGREGRGVLLNGDVWAWQAKFIFEFDSSAIGQVGASVRRVLELEPNLKRYFVALPIDLPAGDTEDRKSADTRWLEKVTDWETAAREKGREVEFNFVGAHELLNALTEPRHAGRARFWFDAEVLTPEWQSRRLEEVIAKAGHRYSPRLHVEVDTVQALDGVSRAEAYVRRWQTVLAALREARRRAWRAPEDVAESFGDAVPRCATALDEADSALLSMIESARSADELPPLEGRLDRGVEALLGVDDLLHEHSLTQDRNFVGDAGTLYSNVQRALSALRRAAELAGSATTTAARNKTLLLTGRAGAGKTHLLCDAAARRVANGLPTIVLLGQDFDARSLLWQIPEQSQLGGTLDDVLAVLDGAAEAAGCIGLLMIDAVNESERSERWRDDARALKAAAGRYQHVGLVVSCRTEFMPAVIGDDDDMAQVEHAGFAEATDVAVERFTREFGLEAPAFPVLNPEFSNPLFLKLTCEALTTLGATRFQFGSAGLSTVCDAFLEAVNQRLSESGRCDYDVRSDPVGTVVRQLASLGTRTLDRSDVQRITEEALPGRAWSHSLMRGLIAEGVLAEMSDGRIVFGYQRLGDVARAIAIAERSTHGVREWLRGLGNDLWREQGVLSALAVILPERHQVELVDLGIDDEGRVSHELIDSFLESLVLRSAESVSGRTVELVRSMLDAKYQVGEIWDRLIRIACVPKHPLNANWIHAHLASYDVADRDLFWSLWLVGAAEQDTETAVRRLLDWAWPEGPGTPPAIPDEVVALATQTLGWLLTTPDRRVRDRATKALVCLAESSPATFGRVLAGFHGTNDPYVVERLTAAACAVVLRMDDAEASAHVAAGVSELVGESWPEHLMTRDFIRRVFDAARAQGWTGPATDPPDGADWPVPTRPISEIEALAGPPNFQYGSIWHSLAGMGDFGRYVLQSSLGDVVSDDPEALVHMVERAVFDRVLALGWTPDRFGDVDRQRSGLRDAVVERIGKKYQWIGLYEVLGRVADHHSVKPAWSEEEERPYAYAEQLVWRDIDPTVLARKPVALSEAQRSWFSPVHVPFPPRTTDDYPDDMSGVADPLDLISVTDGEGTPCLVLLSQLVWQEPQPPEIEALEIPRLEVWMQVHAYLVPVPDMARLLDWAKGQDWFGRWMPEVPDAHNVLLGAHPNDPMWAVTDGSVDWWEPRSGPQPCDLLHCGAWYGGTGTSRDASAENETRGYVPSRRLSDILGVSRGVDFRWRDADGVAVHDPSVITGGPATLVMRRDLVSRLAEAGLTLFWTLLAGKELHRRIGMPPGDDYRWVSASASYILNRDGIEQIGATAKRLQPGPTTERNLDWTTRKSER
jgi:hypothetical protein